MIAERAQQGKNYGIVLVPEGLIECVPEVGTLIAELNEVLASFQGEVTCASVAPALSASSRQVWHLVCTFLRRPGMRCMHHVVCKVAVAAV